MKLGSLFDGIGGFPLAGSRHGITPVWASEIEAGPMAITKKHFPDMVHLGDVTKIDGAGVEPVDVITFGSPCQDLSVAGKRAGLDGARSGLFMEAVRIIKEMRDATDGPRFAVWENVPGAFSSNSGEDFRVVLEELCRVKDPTFTVPSSKWEPAGLVEGDGWSVAWRVLDAQYWGVPQRRKRIFVVADFGGSSAGQVLFERESLRRDSAKGEGKGQGTAADVEGGTGAADAGLSGVETYSIASKQISQNIGLDVAMPLMAHDYKEPQAVAYAVRMREGCEGGGKGPLIQTDKSGTIATGNGQAIFAPTICFEPRSQDGVPRIHGEVSPTLNTAQGGQRQPCVATPIGFFAMQAIGEHKESSSSSSLKQRDYKDATDLVVTSVDCRNLYENEEISGTLQHKAGGGYSLNYQNPVRIGYQVRRLTPTECERLQGFPDKWTEGHSDTVRYKALGNSVAVPCVEFVMEGIVREWVLS